MAAPLKNMPKNHFSGLAALKGLAWLFLYSVVGKGSSLLAQIALGWLLPREDYGLWAIALSISTVTAMLRNGGSAKLLIQSGAEYETLAPTVMKFALAFNLLAMALLMTGGAVAARLHHSPSLLWMIAILAVEMPLATPAAVFSAKLSIDHQFGTLSKIGMASSFLRQGLTVALAYAGFGPLSFAVPVVAESSFISFCSWRAVRQWPGSGPMDWKQFSGMFSQSRWIMLGTLVAGLSLQGDYLAVSFFENREQLGVYFFALQLVGAVAIMFTLSIETVMLPMLAPLGEDPGRQRAAFANAAAGLCLLAVPTAAVGYFLAEPAVRMLWQGRWDEAIPLVKMAMLGLPGWIMVALGRSLLEAKGMWRGRLLHMGLFGLGGMFAAGCAAYLGGLFAIACAVSSYRLVYGLVQIAVVGRQIGIPPASSFKLALQPILLTAAAAILSEATVHGRYFDISNTMQDVAMAGLYLIIFLLLAVLFLNKQWNLAMGLVRKKNQHAY